MTDSSDKTRGRAASKTKQAPKKNTAPQTAAPAPKTKAAKIDAKQTLSKKHLEEARQQLVVRGVVIGLVIAVVSMIAGIVYEFVWVPSQAIAQVNNQELTRGQYWEQYRYELASQVVQSLQLAAMFGSNEQFGTQFTDRSPVINQQAATIRTDPLNEEVVTKWQERQMVSQGAASMGITIPDDDINQQLAQDLAMGLLPGAMPESPFTVEKTNATTNTTALSDTLSSDIITDTVTTDVVTPTEAVPTATPNAAESQQQLTKIFDKTYEMYQAELDKASDMRQMTFKPNFTKDDFRQAMVEMYRDQLAREKIQEQLVPEDGFVVDTTPTSIQARQIFLQVNAPITLTDTLSDTDTTNNTIAATHAMSDSIEAAFAAREKEANALVRRVKKGDDFAELASEYSDDIGSRDNGGSVGYFEPNGTTTDGSNTTYPPEFVAAAFALEGDDVSAPVRTQFGWHIIQVTERITATKEQQLEKARTEAFETWLTEQRKQATVVVPTEMAASLTPEPTPIVEPVYAPGPPTPMPTPITINPEDNSAIPLDSGQEEPFPGGVITPIVLPTSEVDVPALDTNTHNAETPPAVNNAEPGNNDAVAIPTAIHPER